MPAKTTIFDTRANVVHTFNLAPRNTILFSPHGRLVLVAGFGNLAGQMDIYDLEKDYKKLVTIEAANASVCEWSPDGRHILTATTSPRLRVDNGVRIWHATGPLVYKEDMNELYTINWRPQSTSKHPLRDPNVPPPAPHSSALAYLSTVKTPSKPAGAYRPPGARGTLTPLAFRREDEGGAAYVNNGISSTAGGSGVNGFGRPKTKYVPGAEAAEPALPAGAAPGGGVSLGVPGATPVDAIGDENLSKAALKNKKKREAKKAAAAAEKTADIPPPANAAVPNQAAQAITPQSNGHLNPANAVPQGQRRERSRSRNRKPREIQPPPGLGPRPAQQQQPPFQAPATTPAPATPAPAQAPEPDLSSPGNSGGSPHERKLRALTKKLRAIDELKMRQAGGEKLELSQLSKMRTEDQVRKELAQLDVGE